jgi:hypothetical protein
MSVYPTELKEKNGANKANSIGSWAVLSDLAADEPPLRPGQVE